MRSITDRELDKLLKEALHDEADYLTVSERLKEHIDKEIAVRTHLYKALTEILKSDEIKKYFNDTYDGAVILVKYV